MESTESIVLRMKLDAVEVNAGTAAMMSKQRVAAREYEAMWTGALAKKDAAEKAELDASFARYTANLEKRKAADAAYFAARRAQIEETNAIADIANGSGGMGWRKAEKGAASGAASALEGGAVGAAAGAVLHRAGQTSIFREIQVLLHEGIAGRWKQFISSFSRLLMFMGLTAETLVTSIPIIGSGAAAIIGNWKLRSSLGEQAGAYGTNEGTIGTESIISKRLREEMEKLRKGGKITQEQESLYNSQLGSMSGIRQVQRAIAPLLPEGFETYLPTTQEQIRKADAETEMRRHELEMLIAGKEKEKNLTDDILERARLIVLTRTTLAGLDKDSLEYHQLKADLMQQELDFTKLDQKATEDRNADEKKRQQETKEWQTWSQHAARDWMKGKIEGATDEAGYPTVEQMAGRQFMSQLNSYYGEAKYRKINGRWRQVSGFGDLGSGDGQFAETAQDYALAQKQQIWDREHGNMATAEQDRQRMISDRNVLVASGAASPTMLLSKIGEDTDKLRTLFTSLVDAGVIIRDPPTP